MPWKVEKKGQTYAVVKKGSGEEVARHQTSTAASAQVRALYSNYEAEGKKVPKNKNSRQAKLSSAAARRAMNSKSHYK